MQIREVFEAELEIISRLAHEIWPIVYSDMISEEQMAYMLNWMYSNESLQTQLQEGHRFFIALDGNKKPVGFCSYATHKHPLSQRTTYKLHKLYVMADLHKKGIGKLLLYHIVSLIDDSKPCSFILNVNKNNPARFFYEHIGFKIIQEVDNEIGNGFFMNDYVMELEIQ